MNLVVGAKESIVFTGDNVAFKTSDVKIATVDEKTGEVTAVAAGKATITVTCGDETKSVTVNVSNALLKSVSQTYANKLVAVFAGDTTKVTKDTLKIKADVAGTNYAVRNVTVDAKDKTLVTIETTLNINDGKEYTVTYTDASKAESTAKFTATDNKPDSVTVDKTSIPFATRTEVKGQVLDANGVILGEVNFGAATSNLSITAKTLTSGSYVSGKFLYIIKKDETAVVTVKYTSGKYENGKPVGDIEKDITITAGAQTEVTDYALKIDSAANKTFAKAAESNLIKGQGTTAYAYVQIKNADAKEIEAAQYTDYSVESADSNVFAIIGSKTLAKDTGIQVKGINEGTSYLIVKKGTAIVQTLEVKVVGAAKLNAANTTVANPTIVLSTAVADLTAVDIKAKDQYNQDYSAFKVTQVEYKGDTTVAVASRAAVDGKFGGATQFASNGLPAEKWTSTVATTAAFRVAATAATGTYTYLITLVDNADANNKVVLQVTVTVGSPSGSDYNYKAEISQATFDTTVKKETNVGNKYVTVGISEFQGGVKTSAKITSAAGVKVYGDKVVTKVTYAVKKADGTDLETKWWSVDDTTSCAAIHVVSFGSVDVASKGATTQVDVIEKLPTGSYTIIPYITYNNGDTANTMITIEAASVTLTVTDAQPMGGNVVSNINVNATALTGMFEYEYVEGLKYSANNTDKVKAVAYSGFGVGDKTYVNQVRFALKVPDTEVYILKDVDVHETFEKLNEAAIFGAAYAKQF